MKPQPFYRETGAGPLVVCIHSNASTSSQWRGLMDLLSPTHRVVAPDSYGSGKSPDWHSRLRISLHDEVEFLEPVFAQSEVPFTLVGHSYGGAVALRAAVEQPGRVRALILYEPTLFSVVEADSVSPNDADGIRQVLSDAGAALDRGDTDAAAEHFIDYWMGAGTFRRNPEERRTSIAASTVNARRWGHALTTEDTPLAAFRALEMPVLYMIGDHSPRSAHAVGERLMDLLPNATMHRFSDLGHMGPVTHPDIVNPVIARFIREEAAESSVA